MANVTIFRPHTEDLELIKSRKGNVSELVRKQLIDVYENLAEAITEAPKYRPVSGSLKQTTAVIPAHYIVLLDDAASRTGLSKDAILRLLIRHVAHRLRLDEVTK